MKMKFTPRKLMRQLQFLPTIVLLLICISSEKSFAQTTVFSDDFNRGSGTSSVMTNGGTPSMNYTQVTTSSGTGTGTSAIGRLNQSSGSDYAVQLTTANATTTQSTTLTSGSTAATLSATNSAVVAGAYVIGNGIPANTFVSAVSGTTLTLSQNATVTGAGNTLSFGSTATQNGTWLINSTAVTLSSSNSAIVVGAPVSGAGIAAGTTVAAVSGTSLTLSANSTAAGTASQLTFGFITGTASTVSSGSTAVTLSASNSNIKVGAYILGVGIPANTSVAAISGTSLTLSQAATANGSSIGLAFGPTTTSTASTITSGSTAVTLSASNNAIVVGAVVTGTGIAPGTTVSAISGTALTLSTNATASGSGVTLSIGSNTNLVVQTIGTTSLTGTTSTFLSPYNSTLSSNTSDVVWTFNMKTNRSTFPLSGFNAGNYAGGVVLGCTSGTFAGAGAGNGYAVIFERATSFTGTTSGATTASTAITLTAPNTNIIVGMAVTGTGLAASTTVAAISGTSLTLSANATTSSGTTLTFGGGTTVKLSRFATGVMTTAAGTLTQLLISPTEFFTNANKTNWATVKVTYTPSSNTWAMSLRNDAAASTDFTTSMVSCGTVVDATYTGTALTNFGFVWNHNSTGSFTSNTMLYDNFKVVVNNPTIFTPNPTTLSAYNYAVGSGPSTSQSFKIGGTLLTSNITISAPTNYEINNPAVNGVYGSSLTLTPSSGNVDSSVTVINVRLIAGLPGGSYNGEIINITATNAPTKTVTCNGSVTSTPTIISSTASLTQFANTNAGSTSGSTSFNISGTNLSDDITVTAPANFEVSKNNSTFSSSVVYGQSAGTVSLQAVYVRYAPTGSGSLSGNIALTSTSATTQNVAVSGYLSNFYYTKGSGGSLSNTADWSGTIDGTGTTTPTDFSTAGVNYNVVSSRTTSTPWTISGTGSKVIVGNATVPGVTLTIASAAAITTTSPVVMDITAASSGTNTVIIQSTTAPVWGTINAGSTVEYQAASNVTPPTAGFGNLTISAGTNVIFGSSSVSTTVNGNLMVSGGVAMVYNTTILGNLTISGTGVFALDNVSSRTVTVGGNVSFAGTGGINNSGNLGINAGSSSGILVLSGSGKTISNTASGNTFAKLLITLNTGCSYALATNFDYSTALSGRIIQGSGSLDIGPYTLSMGNGQITATNIINTNPNSNIITSCTTVPAITPGLSWLGKVTFTAGGQTIPTGSYRHLVLAMTSTTATSIAAGGVVSIVDTLSFTGSKALGNSTGIISYNLGAVLYMNGSGSVTFPNDPVEFPAVDGPTHVTCGANTLLFASGANITRTIPGNFRLNGGSFTINNGNTLVMGDTANIYKNGGNLNASGGTLNYGTSPSGLVKIFVEVSTGITTEFLANQTPGKVGKLTINPGVTYTFSASTGSRATVDFVNNGVLVLGTSSTFTVNGTIVGSGTITSNSNANLVYGGSSATLNFTPGSAIAKDLTVACTGTLTLGSAVTLSRNLILTTGSLTAGANDITVNGNITGLGTFNGSGKILVSGSSAATSISGITASNLEINNGFADTLTGSPFITGTLTLTSGKIVIPVNDTLSITSGNAIAGSPFSNSKYIVTLNGGTAETKGRLLFSNFSGSRLFPVGDATNYLPVTINPSSSSDFAVNAFVGTTYDGTISGTPLTSNMKKDLADALWGVNRFAGSGSATVTLGWPAAIEGSNFTAFTGAQIGISSYDGSLEAWGTSSGSGDNSANTATRSFTTYTSSDSVLAVGKVGQRLTGASTVLPGEILINQFNPGYAAGSTNAYIELVNTTNKSFDLSKLRIAYQNAAGVDGTAGKVLSGTLLPYSFWLLSPKSVVTIGQTNRTRDGEINGGFGTDGQLALEEILSVSTVDALGYGTLTGGSYSEGTSAAAPTAFGGLKRNIDGVDANNNSADFSAVLVANIDLRGNDSRLLKTGVSLAAGTYKDLSVTGNSSFAGAVNVTGKIAVRTGATLTTNNNLTLKSNASGTASIAQSGGSITGNVVVERYIPASGRRAWRMLSIPTGGAQTINAAWQEGQAPLANGNPGYGTLLTKIGGGSGYDANTTGNSLLTLTPGNPGSWVGVAATTGPIATTSGYMVYVRGDRSSTITGGPVSQTATTLRSNGTLYQGSQSAISVAAGNNVLIGNVYASAIDFANITKSGVSSFKVWDPKLAGTSGVGGFQTFSSTNGYDPTPGGGSYGNVANSRIENGQAFIVSSVSGGSITLTEACKVNGSNNNVFRQANTAKQLKTNLYLVEADGSKLIDGVSVVFDNAFTNGVDDNDAIKINNIGENIGINTDNIILAVDAHKTIESADVIALQLNNLKQVKYQLELLPKNLSNENLTAYVVDNFLKTTNAVSLKEGSLYNFTVTSDAASFAKDRFSIVFKNNAATMATLNVKGNEKNAKIQVEWNVSNENGIKAYHVERSANGKDFEFGGNVNAIANGTPAMTYTWLDEKAVKGYNYYRIKSISKSGEISYSGIVKVLLGKDKVGFAIYPNPVVNNRVNLQFINQAEGVYTISISNKSGQMLFSRSVTHNGGSATQSFRLPSTITQGTYQLEVKSADGKKNIENIIIANN